MSSLMNNFDIAREALETSRGSSGSADTELDKYMQSIEAKTQQLKATAQDLSQNVLNSDFLKGAIDGARGFLEIINTLIQKFPALTGVAVAGTAAIIKNWD